jgi:DMSO reductase anchor subunit
MGVLRLVAVGTIAIDAALTAAGVVPERSATDLLGLMIGLAALGASVLHLGRPRLAWRAVLGLRHSWLSREVAAFAAFAVAAALNATLRIGEVLPAASPWARLAVVATGFAGIACSVELYAVTRRAWWTRWRTAARFGATAVIGGFPLVAAVHLLSDAPEVRVRLLTIVVPVLVTATLVTATAARRGLPRSGPHGSGAGELAASRSLLRGALRPSWRARLACAATAVAIGASTLHRVAGTRPSAWSAAPIIFAAAVAILGELVERHLFFTASAPAGMPGEPS